MEKNICTSDRKLGTRDIFLIDNHLELFIKQSEVTAFSLQTNLYSGHNCELIRLDKMSTSTGAT